MSGSVGSPRLVCRIRKMLRFGFIQFQSSKLFFGQLKRFSCAVSTMPSNCNTGNVQGVPRSKIEFLAKMLFMPSQSPPDSRLLKIAVLGFPNAGKSSLVNMLANWRVCAVSGKAHTTRSKQTVVFTKDNIQLAFVDLPGLVSARQVRQFKLERTFIRDPHSAIFDADLILVVVDASNKYARLALDPELLKALHFFPDKESILILNKIDKSRGDHCRLLDITRRLTGGVVGASELGTKHLPHLDSFANKFIERAELGDNWSKMHPSIEDIVYPLLPSEAHEAAQARLQHVQKIMALLSPPVQIESLPKSKIKSKAVPNIKYLTSSSENQNEPAQTLPVSEPLNTELTSGEIEREPEFLPKSILKSGTNETPAERCATEIDHQSIADFFATFKPSKDASSAIGTSLATDQSSNIPSIQEIENERLEAMLERVKDQLMLKSATKEEVALRRQQWKELGVKLQGVKHWEGFNQVFMVSSATGEGIDNLRKYLLSRAKPGQWLLSPALITDVEPTEIIRMCVWAHCLDKLPQEIPYGVLVTVDECEHVKIDQGDDRVYVHVRLRCPNERSIKNVIGPQGKHIREIAAAVKIELGTLFQTTTVVKLTAEAIKPNRGSIKRLRAAKDFSEVYPNFDNCNQPQPGIETVEL
nr:GTP binding protein era [Hymenolepis microstoma]